MKYLKITVIIFVGVLILKGTSVLAKRYTFTQVKVPALSIKTDVAEATKENVSDQTFTKFTCRDTLSNEERGVEVRTYSYYLDRVNYWVKVPKDKTVNISNGLHDESGDYRLEARTEANKVTGCIFSGVWNLD